MSKVQCKLCEFENNNKCSIKKSSVKLNKHRICKYYKQDNLRIEQEMNKKNNNIPVITRPDWFWDREKRRAAKYAAIQKELDKLKPEVIKSNKYPLTGDLSRFIGSTATED